MLIPIKKRVLENLIDEVGKLQASIAALESELKKKKAALKDEMEETNVTSAQGRRFQVTWVSRENKRTDWQAIMEVLFIDQRIVQSYTKVTQSEYPLVKIRRDSK